jgi:hypothetical protein
MLPAIYAWAEMDPEVFIVPIEQRFYGGVKVSDLGGGMWRYEYALQNNISDRAAGWVGIPIPHNATITNIGFNDVDYHSGEPFDGTDWQATVLDGAGPAIILWQTETYEQNPDANALRWGTLYNFRFDIDAPPVGAEGSIGLFKPGSPSELKWEVFAPDRCGDAVCEAPETEASCPGDCASGGSDAGEVPDGDDLAGQQLLLTLQGNGDIVMSWDDSCLATDTDYAIYEGTLGNFTSHGPKLCSTGGLTSAFITPGGGDHYYLSVPNNGSFEGSYGSASDSTPRVQGGSACMMQSVGTCQ